MAEPIRLTWVFPELVQTRWVLPPNRPTALAAVIAVGGASSAQALSFDDTLTALGVDNVQDAIVALYALMGASPPVVTPVLLSGALLGSSALAGALSVTRALSGQATGSGLLTAALTVEREGLSGSVVAAGLLTGSLQVTRALIGAIEGTSAAVGALEVTRALAASIAASSVVSGEVTVTRALMGTAYGMGAMTGALTVETGPAVTYLPASPAPLAAFSLAKLVSTYSGPTAEACAVGAPNTPTTTVPITVGSNGQPDVSAAIAAFGTTFHVWKLYDQMGGTAAVAATASERMSVIPTVNASVLGLYNESDRKYTVAGTTLSRQSFSMFGVVGGAMQGSNNKSPFGAGDGFSNGFSIITTTTDGIQALGTNFFRTFWHLDQGPTVVSAVGTASNTKMRRDERRATLAASTNVTMSGLTIGSGFYGTEGVWIYGFVAYNSSLADTAEGNVSEALQTIFAIPTRTKGIILAGDSIQRGQGATLGQTKQHYLNGLLTGDPYISNLGLPGQGMQNPDAVAFAGYFDAALTKNIYCFNWGSNNIAAGSTAAALFGADNTTGARLTIARAKAAGFTVVVETLIKRTALTAPQEAERVAYNQLLRDNAAALGFSVIDYGDTVYPTGDGTHPTSAGYQTMAGIAAPVLQAALA